MLLLRSPLLTLLAAAAAALVPQRGCGILAVLLLWYACRQVWQWWCQLVITIDGVAYKQDASCSAYLRGARSERAGSVCKKTEPKRPTEKRSLLERSPDAAKDGFVTPREESEDGRPVSSDANEECGSFVEWAPFAPSLRYGEVGSLSSSPPPVASAMSATGSLSSLSSSSLTGAMGSPPSTVPTVGGSPPVPYWLECDASVFDIRNIRYKQTKEKVPSEFALYDCVGTDMVRDKRRIDGLMDRLPGDLACGTLPQSPLGAKPWSASWGVPRVVVVNCQLPYKAGWLMAAHPEEDGGLSVVNYFVLSREASEMLAEDHATPALRLWRRFVEDGVSTKDGISFKVVGRVEDLEKYEVPETFHRFNNKPVLLTKSSRVITKNLPEVIEIEYDVRTWVYAARSMLANYHYRAAEAELQIGYVVEGKSDDELPEQILGCFKLVNMDILQAKWVSLM